MQYISEPLIIQPLTECRCAEESGYSREIDGINELSGDLGNINQLTRWVNDKEHHADDIRQIVTQYLKTQRLKLPDEEDPQAVAAYE